MSWTVFPDSPDASTTCAQATRSFGIASAGPGFAVRRLQRQGITSPPLYHIVPAHARQACSLLTGQARSAGYQAGACPDRTRGHPLQGAGGRGGSVHDPEYARNDLGRHGDERPSPSKQRAQIRKMWSAASGAVSAACPLRARSAGQGRVLTVTHGQPGIPADLRTGRLTRCANRPVTKLGDLSLARGSAGAAGELAGRWSAAKVRLPDLGYVGVGAVGRRRRAG